MLCSLSNLKEQDVQKIQSAEAELGVTLLAFSCQDTAPATLEEDKVSKIKALEESLGLALVAVDAN